MAAMCVAVFLQPTEPRKMAAFYLAFLFAAHDIFLSDLDGLEYFGSAALIDSLVIILLSSIKPIPRLVLSLQAACLASIVVNFVGWWLWVRYLPSDVYVMSMTAIYTWIMVSLIKKDRNYVGGYPRNSSNTRFHFAGHTSISYRNQNKG